MHKSLTYALLETSSTNTTNHERVACVLNDIHALSCTADKDHHQRLGHEPLNMDEAGAPPPEPDFSQIPLQERCVDKVS